MSERAASDAHFILGHPIAHSKSPAMYNALYEHLDLPWTYGFMDCPTAVEAERFLAERKFLSVNVTTPYKPLALAAANVSASSAKLAKGANVLASKGDALIAYNVDGQGCIAFLERAGVSFSEARVVVCGTGPTALSIVHAAALAGAAEVTMLSRDKERSRSALEEYASSFSMLASTAIGMPAAHEHHLSFGQAYEHVALRFGSYATSTRAIAGADIIIDATPLGMHEGDPAPFDVDLISSDQVVLDVVYGHGESVLVGAARAAGAAAFDGAGMLVAQAVATAGIVCDIAGVDMGLSFDDAFALMANAAGFAEL